MSFDLNSLNEEQIAKAQECETVEEFVSFVNAEGFELTVEEAEALIEAAGELADADLEAVAGGGPVGGVKPWHVYRKMWGIKKPAPAPAPAPEPAPEQ